MIDYTKFLYLAIRSALDAGQEIMRIYLDTENDFKIEKKQDNQTIPCSICQEMPQTFLR